jgi:hypothetical protein
MSFSFADSSLRPSSSEWLKSLFAAEQKDFASLSIFFQGELDEGESGFVD